MPKLPQFQNDDQAFQLMQNSWGSILQPLLDSPSNQSSVLRNVSLVSGTNVINHLLGRKLQGWKVVRQRASAALYDAQDGNPRPELTLLLVASAPVVVDLEVF